MAVEHDPSLGLPGHKEIDNKVPFRSNLEALLGRIFHLDGTVNGNHPDLKGVMELAEEKDLDVILVPQSDGTHVQFGRWLADHKGLLEIGAVTTLGITTVATTIGAGLILRKHHRESAKDK